MLPNAQSRAAINIQVVSAEVKSSKIGTTVNVSIVAISMDFKK